MKVTEKDESVIMESEGCFDEQGRKATLSVEIAKDCSVVELRCSTGQFANINTDRLALEAFRQTLGLVLEKDTNKPYATLELDKQQLDLICNIVHNWQSDEVNEHRVWLSICDKIDQQLVKNLH